MIPQRTIQGPVSTVGVGLQTGKKSTVTLKSAPADSGIHFIRTDLPSKPLIHVQSLTFDEQPSARGAHNERRTTVGFSDIQIQTVEHLMAALNALSIDNIVIEVDNEELPGLDGSAKGYVELLKKAVIQDQNAAKRVLVVREPAWYQDEKSFLAVFPDDVFKISCLISYPNRAIGAQYLSYTMDEESFTREIAPARTFCLEEEARLLLDRGLGKGASYENTLVFGQAGPIKNVLRFPDEPVRHKILDLIGDLYLTGYRLQGHVVAIKSGHRQNLELVRKLKRLAEDQN